MYRNSKTNIKTLKEECKSGCNFTQKIEMLTGSHRQIANYLVGFAKGCDNNRIYVYPRLMAIRLGIHKTTVYRTLKWLVRNEFIERVDNTNLYILKD